MVVLRLLLVPHRFQEARIDCFDCRSRCRGQGSGRWITWLGGALVGSAVFTAAALAGLGPWLLAPAIVVGPGIGGIALVWLAITTDTNSAVARVESDAPVLAEAA